VCASAETRTGVARSVTGRGEHAGSGACPLKRLQTVADGMAMHVCQALQVLGMTGITTAGCSTGTSSSAQLAPHMPHMCAPQVAQQVTQQRGGQGA
jgi:hypothetical protein